MTEERSPQYIVIIGCGRLGALLANRLSLDEHSIVVIDSDERSFERLKTEFSGFSIQRDATEFAALEEAKIDKASMLLATTDRDNVNLMVAQIAREIFNVPHVIALVHDPECTELYAGLGIQVINPIELMAEKILESF